MTQRLSTHDFESRRKSSSHFQSRKSETTSLSKSFPGGIILPRKSDEYRLDNDKSIMKDNQASFKQRRAKSMFHSRWDSPEWLPQSLDCERSNDDVFDLNKRLLPALNSPPLHRFAVAALSPWFEEANTNFGSTTLSERLSLFEFDTLEYSTSGLVDVALEVFFRLQLDKQLKISHEQLRTFVLQVQSLMQDNPYHNWFHVVDVLQAVYCLIHQSHMEEHMSSNEKFSVLVAALCHDLDHSVSSEPTKLAGTTHVILTMKQGLNDDFFAKTKDERGSSSLVRHHSFRSLQLLTNSHGMGLLDSLDIAEKNEVMDRVDKLILATDMSRHEEYMVWLKSRAHLEPPDLAVLEEGKRQMILEILIKCADLSNVLRPFPIAKKWARRITDEYFKQGDLERSMGLEVSPMCDRQRDSRVLLQKRFVEFVGPFFRNVAELLPGLKGLAQRLQHTRDMWGEYESDDVLLAE